MTRHTFAIRAISLGAGLLTIGCGNKSGQGPTPTDVVATASASAPPVLAPEPPPSPFHVAVDSKEPLVFAGLEGGVFVADGARTRVARAVGPSSALAVSPMPEGLPTGPGRILRAAGRLPGAIWLTFENEGDAGKAESTPLYRLGKDAWKQWADDWKPMIAAWSKNRILAVSTSSGRLKIKVIEPSSPQPPDDLPSTQLNDESCAKSLVVRDLGATATGEVFAAGNCKPDLAAGAGASAMRYVVVRWSAAKPAASEADGGVSGNPGLVDVLPGVSVNLSHQALFARSGSDVFAIASEGAAKAGNAARLFHFDGTTWGVEALPATIQRPRAITGTTDGTLWIAAEHSIWRRPEGGAWELVPPPDRAFPREPATWDLGDAWSVSGTDVWMAARRSGPSGTRHAILRLGEGSTTRWE